MNTPTVNILVNTGTGSSSVTMHLLTDFLRYVIKNGTMIQQPACSPDLSPANHYLHPKMIALLMGHKLVSTEEVKRKKMAVLKEFA